MKKSMIRHGTTIILIMVLAFLSIASGGTYTFRGNTATLMYEDETITVTVSGNTLSGTYRGTRFTATRVYFEDVPTSSSNPFMGAWMDTDGNIILFDDTAWLVIPGENSW